MGGQSSSSFVPSVIKTNVPLNNDDPAHKEFLLQRYGERIEKLSQQDRLSKFCTEAGFLTIVEIGQYFMTQDIEEFSQFTDSVACREYTLPRDEDTSEPKAWIRGNTKIGPYWKLQPVACKVNTECLQQAAADSRGSRTCVCANTFTPGWHTQEEKDELTSCRVAV